MCYIENLYRKTEVSSAAPHVNAVELVPKDSV